jgi:hypothetical protein
MKNEELLTNNKHWDANFSLVILHSSFFILQCGQAVRVATVGWAAPTRKNAGLVYRRRSAPGRIAAETSPNLAQTKPRGTIRWD